MVLPSVMRPEAATLATLLLLALPTASADGDGLSFSGPSILRLDGPTTATLQVALRLDGVVCTSAAEVPVTLSLLRASGAEADLLSERVVFRFASHAAARSWSGRADVDVTIAPREDAGVVELLASYDLPPQCSAVGRASSGEARHTVRVEEATADAPATSSDLVRPAARTPAVEETSALPLGVQVAIVGTSLGAAAVTIKRVRGKAR